MTLTNIKAAALAAVLAVLCLSETALATTPTTLSDDEARICVLLELAHETTCAEYELVQAERGFTVDGALAPADVTGSVRSDADATTVPMER